MTRAALRTVDDHGDVYQALLFWCPGCQVIRDAEPQRGLHMLPVTGDGTARPVWQFDGNLDAPTLSPSILTRTKAWTEEDAPDAEFVCHSFLRGGRFEFLNDCTHALKNQTVELPDLPAWAVNEATSTEQPKAEGPT